MDCAETSPWHVVGILNEEIDLKPTFLGILILYFYVLWPKLSETTHYKWL